MADGGYETFELEPGDEAALTMWDRRMVAAIQTANAARKGVKLLRVFAAVVVAIAAAAFWLAVFYEPEQSGNGAFGIVSDTRTPDRIQWAQFLSAMVTPVFYAALVVAASYLLAVYAARLDMDIILADDEELSRMENSVDD